MLIARLPRVPLREARSLTQLIWLGMVLVAGRVTLPAAETNFSAQLQQLLRDNAAMRAQNPAQAERFVFITGDVVTHRTQKFFEERDRPCLPKPFSLHDFRGAVRKILANKPVPLPGISEN